MGYNIYTQCLGYIHLFIYLFTMHFIDLSIYLKNIYLLISIYLVIYLSINIYLFSYLSICWPPPKAYILPLSVLNRVERSRLVQLQGVYPHPPGLSPALQQRHKIMDCDVTTNCCRCIRHSFFEVSTVLQSYTMCNHLTSNTSIKCNFRDGT